MIFLVTLVGWEHCCDRGRGGLHALWSTVLDSGIGVRLVLLDIDIIIAAAPDVFFHPHQSPVPIAPLTNSLILTRPWRLLLQ